MSHDPDAVLDCRGQRCPLPVVNLARHLKDMEVGSVLRVLCDDPVAALDIAAWCHLRAQEYLGQAEGIDTDNVTSAYDVRRLT